MTAGGGTKPFTILVEGAWREYPSEAAYLQETDDLWTAGPTLFTLLTPAPIGTRVRFGLGSRSGIIRGIHRRKTPQHCSTCHCEGSWDGTCYGWWQIDQGLESGVVTLVHPRQIVAVISG